MGFFPTDMQQQLCYRLMVEISNRCSAPGGLIVDGAYLQSPTRRLNSIVARASGSGHHAVE